MVDVVGIAPAGGDFTAGMSTADIAEIQSPPDCRGYHPGAATYGQRLAFAVENDAGEVAVTGEAPGGFGGDGPGFQIDDVVAGEIGGAQGDDQMGPFSSLPRPVGGVQMPATDLDQGIGTALLRAAGVAGVERSGFGQRSDGGEHHRAALRVQIAVEAHHTRPGRRDMEAAPEEGPAGVGLGAVRVGKAPPVGQRQGEHPRRQGTGLGNKQGFVATEQVTAVIPSVGQEPDPALGQVPGSEGLPSVVHVPQSHGHPEAAAAYCRGITSERYQPSGGGSEPAGQGDAPSIRLGDRRRRLGIHLGPEPGQSAHLLLQLIVGQSLERERLRGNNGLRGWPQQGLDGHT